MISVEKDLNGGIRCKICPVEVGAGRYRDTVIGLVNRTTLTLGEEENRKYV